MLFGGWLPGEGLGLEEATTPVLLRFLAAAARRGCPGYGSPAASTCSNKAAQLGFRITWLGVA